MGYQAWLKSSGYGAYLESYGADNGKQEKGSYMANRCCDLVRCMFCLNKSIDEDGEDDNDATSEARERRSRRQDGDDAPNGEGILMVTLIV